MDEEEVANTNSESDKEMCVKEEESSTSSSTIASDSEEEDEKKPRISDPCLLCAQTVDLKGNDDSIAEEIGPDDESGGDAERQQLYTHQELFTCFCKMFGMKPTNKPGKTWDFDRDHVFPFCEMCKLLLSSLVTVYSKLEELESVIKEKMLEGEWKYVEEELYSRIDDRYLNFRKKALNGLAAIDSDDTSDSNHTPSSGEAIRKTNFVTGVCTRPHEIIPVSNIQPPRRTRGRVNSDFTRSIEAVSELDDSDHNPLEDNGDDDCPVTFSDSSFSSTSDSESSDIEAVSQPKYARIVKKTLKGSGNTRPFLPSPRKNLLQPPSSSGSTILKGAEAESLVFIPRHRITLKITPAAKSQQPIPAQAANHLSCVGEVLSRDNDVKEMPKPKTISKSKGNVARNQSESRVGASAATSKVDQRSLGKRKKDPVCKITENKEEGPIVFGPGILMPPPVPLAPFWCRICRERPGFMYKRGLQEHVISVHKVEQEEYGKMCGQVATKWGGRRRYHTAGGWVSECDICAKPFPSCLSNEFRTHKISHMNDTERKLKRGKGKFAGFCRLCENTPEFSSTQLLNEHLLKVHGISTRERYIKMVSFVESRAEDGRKRYHTLAGWVTECDICGRPFLNCKRKDWTDHLWSHLNEKEKEEFLLSNKGSRRHSNLLLPTEEQIEKGHVTQCPICGVFVRNGISFHHHKISHEMKDKPAKKNEALLCNFCGASFVGKKYWLRHMEKLHPGGAIKPQHNCCFPSCDKGFDEEESLQEHVGKEHGNSEENGKRRMCRQCGKVLAYCWAIKDHKLVHSTEKPINCEICNKMFKQKSTLREHMGAVHRMGPAYGTFKCEQPGCEIVFPVRSYLNVHMKKYHHKIKDKASVTQL
ncbi:unnamed protein product [Orchesella dallaii]|uniref:C2H2-type domain-containing protein n=1 Tax=Orchesella dallaii TaxID=48710 RepID=A0ABP1S0S9_9HEXA